MADVWNQPPAHLALDITAGDEHHVRTTPLVEPLPWQLLKNIVQVGVVATAVAFVLSGATAAPTAASMALLSMLLMAAIAYADRQRFLDHGPRFQLVELVEPAPVPVSAPTPSHLPPHRPHATLGPLVEQMAAALPRGLDVT